MKSVNAEIIWGVFLCKDRMYATGITQGVHVPYNMNKKSLSYSNYNSCHQAKAIKRKLDYCSEFSHGYTSEAVIVEPCGASDMLKPGETLT